LVSEVERISGGFETFIFGFRVVVVDGPTAPLAPLLPAGERLIMRIYRGAGVVDRSAWELAVIERVRAAGILAPRVYLYEADASWLGGPFVVLEFVRGVRLDQAALGANPLTVVRLIRNFARAQTQIYAIDWPQGRGWRPTADAQELGPLSWAPERLGAARRDIEARGIVGLLPVVDWLHARRRLFEDEPDVLIHGDYHPLNVFVEGTRVSGIIDWGAGGFADRHEDIGWSSLIIATATAADAKQDRVLAPFRTLGHRIYLAAQWEIRGLNRALLRWGEVYAALRWMLIFLPTYLPNAGPPVLNDDAAEITTTLWVKRVRRFIEQRTRLKLAIEQVP
ncbi:MAG: phosphotransferase, partial [Dehalococcoidia bacterium]